MNAELDRLRDCFEAVLIAEVHRHGGIPHLPPEQIALREAIAAVLQLHEQQSEIARRILGGPAPA